MENRKAFKELKNLVQEIFDDSQKIGFSVRLTGGVAIRSHCERYDYLFENFNRKYEDIDFVCLNKEEENVKQYFINKNYALNQEVYIYSEGGRLIFENNKTKSKIEVFIDELDFCHLINLRKRFLIDYPTISLTDLLLSKMQIIDISERDFIDITILIIEHNICLSEESEKINANYIAKLLSNDWGFYYTFETNIKKVTEFVKNSILPNNIKLDVNNKLEHLKLIISNEEKTITWKMRSVVGSKVKWYKEVSTI